MFAGTFTWPGFRRELDLRMNWIKALLPPVASTSKMPPETPTAYRLEDALRLHLAPVLRADGFKGSGRNYRRVHNGVVQALNVQGSRWGGSFAINLGLQPLAIPAMFDRPVDPGKIGEIDCVLRRRLREGETDQWWAHASAETAALAVQAAARVYQTVGHALLERQSGSTAPLWTLQPSDFDTAGKRFEGFNSYGSPASLAKMLTKLRHASGEMGAARAFADIARQKGLGAVDLAELRAQLDATA